jgi:hypothetical protein
MDKNSIRDLLANKWHMVQKPHPGENVYLSNENRAKKMANRVLLELIEFND